MTARPMQAMLHRLAVGGGPEMSRARHRALLVGLLLFAVAPEGRAQEAVIGEWTAVAGEMYGVPIPEASLPLIRLTFDESEAAWTLPGYPQRSNVGPAFQR